MLIFNLVAIISDIIFQSDFFFRIYLFVWLCRVLVTACRLLSCSPWAPLVAAGGLLNCGMRTLSCGMHVGSISLARDRTWAPCIGSAES